MLGIGEEGFGSALLEDDAFVHEDDAAADVPGEGHLVRDDEHGHALVGKTLHDGEDLADHLGVERARRFVEQEDLRIHGQRAGDGHALLLAAAYGWLSIIRMWADSVEAAMVAQLNTHGETYGYKLVAGRPGPRKWTDAAAAEAELRKALKVDQAYDRKVISPTTAEKLHKSGDIGPKYWARLSNLIGRSDGKPMIVPSTDERPALVPAIENDFENLESENKAE